MQMIIYQDSSFVSGWEFQGLLSGKHIKALRAEGYEIDSVTNKGYKLMMEPDLLTKEEVASCLHTKWLGKDLYCYETMDSTNLEIRRLAEAGAGHGTVAITEEQTMGKG